MPQMRSGLRDSLRRAIKTIPGQGSGLSYIYFLIVAGNEDGVKADRMVTRFVLRRVEYGDERDPKIREYLEKTAPLNNSEKIQKPVFAVVGKNDPRVPWTESRQMLDKLKGNGIITWFLMANDEGHGYAKKKNQDFLFYATVMFVRQFLLGENVSTATNEAQTR